MTEQEFRDALLCNEPEFAYRGKEYAICSPDGRFYVSAEDDPAAEQLVFDTVDDLLDGWMIQGRPLRQILPEIEYG